MGGTGREKAQDRKELGMRNPKKASVVLRHEGRTGLLIRALSAGVKGEDWILVRWDTQG